MKARITGLFGATAGGHEFKPLIIRKARRPRAFRDLKNLSDLPTYYNFNKTAWMTQDIFQDWFTDCFLREIQEIHDPQVPFVFLIDNCTAHNCKALFSQDPNVFYRILTSK